MLPDFSRGDIKYEDVRHKNACTSSANMYKTDFDFASVSSGLISAPSSSASSKVDTKKRNNVNAAVAGKHQFSVRSQLTSEKKEREKKHVERRDNNNKAVKNEEPKPKLPIFAKPKQVVPTLLPAVPKEERAEPAVPEVNPNLLRDWVNLSDTQLVDAKTLETTLQSDFVNGFDINASSIQSQIQDIINSESSLSTDMLMGSHELPNYIQVEGWF